MSRTSPNTKNYVTRSAAILASGNEVTSGQIVNSNAAWLARELVHLGIETRLHLSVPDDRVSLLKGLNIAVRTADLVLIIGGLGPTSDDLTREVVAEFLGVELQLNRRVWNELSERLQKAGRKRTEIYRKQCEFPMGASVLANRVGNAEGFWVAAESKVIAALPGPPAELQPMFLEQFCTPLRSWVPPQLEQLFRWRCLGKPEAELAELIEAQQFQKLRLGYRLQTPFVEIKAWAPLAAGTRGLRQTAGRKKSLQIVKRPIITAAATEELSRLEQLISPWIKLRDDEDFAKAFLLKISGQEVCIEDRVYPYFLSERILSLIRESESPENFERIQISTGPQSPSYGVQKGSLQSDSGYKPKWSFCFECGPSESQFLARAQSQEVVIQGPFPEMARMRNHKAAVELAFEWWERQY